MNKRLIIISVLLLISTTSFAERFVKKTFFSDALGKEKIYYVSYPDGYDASDTTKKFPVIIFLHGASVNAEQMVMPLEIVLSVPANQSLYKNLFKVIFVVPDGSVEPYLGSFYTNSELYGNFEDYISKDLYREIKNNYNTWNNRKKWSIMGHSMGGYGSMKNALKNPDKFIGVASLSGPIHTTYYNEMLPRILSENGDSIPYTFTYSRSLTKLVFSIAGAFSPNLNNDPPIDFPVKSDGTIDQDVAARWEINNPINMIKEWNNDPKLAIFLYCGELDGYKLLSQNNLFADTLTKYNIPYTFKIDPNGDHTQSLATSLPMGINFLYNVMDTSKIETNLSAINNYEFENIFIFPNPVKNKIFFSSKESENLQQIFIYSIDGKVIRKEIKTNDSSEIDVSELPDGIYILKAVYSSGKERYNRFVKSVF